MLMSAIVVLLAVALAAAVVLFARRRPTYSHTRDTISELGEKGSPDCLVVSLGVFLPVGLVTAALWYISRSSSGAAAHLAGAIAVGYCGAAVFPCDPRSPLTGSVRQALHNLAGGVQYVGGTLAMWRLGAQLGQVFAALAIIVGAATIFLSVPAFAPWRGAAQRLAEVALFAGLALGLSLQNAT
jgi:hypothetical membrane protein